MSSCIWDGLTGPSKPSKVTVTPETALLTFVGQTFQLNVRVEDRDGSALAYSTITWSSGDPSVASVSATGIITAKKEGRTTIAATVEGVTGQVVITVEWPKPVTIIIRPSTDLLLESLGETRQLSATVLDRQGRILVGVRVVWSSSDATVVAVDSLGVITSTGRGTVLITAMAGDASATKKVTVSQGLIRLILPDRPITLKLGETYQLSPKVVDSDGNELPPSRLRSYSSTMPAVAMVDSVGMITATGYGTVTIRIRTGYKPTISWPFFLSGTLEVVVGPVSGVVVLTRREVLLTPGDNNGSTFGRTTKRHSGFHVCCLPGIPVIPPWPRSTAGGGLPP